MQEYFNIFCDRVENRLKGSPQEKLLQSIFAGSFSNQLLCLGRCRSVRTTPETFYCISLQVQHKKCLEESIQSLVTVRLRLQSPRCWWPKFCSESCAAWPCCAACGAGRSHLRLHL